MTQGAVTDDVTPAVPFVPLGQFLRPIAFRKNVSGFVDSPYIVYWNVEKK